MATERKATETSEPVARMRRPAVGMPCVYTGPSGATAALLTRQSLTDPTAWDLVCFPPGTTGAARGAVKFAAVPTLGHWSFVAD